MGGVMRLVRGSAAVLIGLAFSAYISAQQPAPEVVRPVDRPENTAGNPKKQDHPNFGVTTDTYINIPSYAFQITVPGFDQIADDGFLFRYLSAGGDPLVAPLIGLPSGVVIDDIEMNDCIKADGDLQVLLVLGDWNQNLGGGDAVLAGLNTVHGCGVDSLSGINYEYDANLGKPLFVFVSWGTNFDGSDKFNDVAIGYHRIVSAAPASPTFLDVPMSNPQFQFVEALAASGITVGCGGGNYCPNNPVTRGQMAVYLAKALGLHWPN
jgi:S-layer homology domain